MLVDKIQADLKVAVVNRDERGASTLRMLLSAINYYRIDLGKELDDNDVILVINKEVKKRNESIEAYKDLRPDLAAIEKSELNILVSYLPQQLDDQTLEKITKEMVVGMGASGLRDMGRVISAIKEKVGNSAESSRIAAMVKKALGL